MKESQISATPLEEVAECDRSVLRVLRLVLKLLAPEDVGERSEKMPVAYGHADCGRRNEEILVNAGAVLDGVAVNCVWGLAENRPWRRNRAMARLPSRRPTRRRGSPG